MNEFKSNAYQYKYDKNISEEILDELKILKEEKEALLSERQ